MKSIQRFQKLIKKAHHIVITTHEYPDADGIGSQVALCMALNSLGKQVVCINEERPMERYHYLDPHGLILSFDDAGQSAPPIDLFIVTDTNDLKRIGPKMRQLAQAAQELLFIDHHPAPPEIASLHCIDTTVAATGELVGNLIDELGIPLNRELALALYTSILIDTNSFRYPTVKAQTHALISKLLATGIGASEAYKKIYGDKKITYLRFLGKTLSNAKSSGDGKIAWIELSEENLQASQIDPEDTLNFVNHLLILKGLKVACVFRQIGDHVKVSFRSAGDTNVNHIAVALGGGGHNHSSAAICKGPLDAVVPEVIGKIEAMLKSGPGTKPT